jgi:predicted DNA-binding antitoxin AbrB/MazE fold protein
MPLTVEAIYENGVLTPAAPLPLDERQRVTVTVHLETSWTQRTAGLMGWTGSTEIADFFATDPELSFPSTDAP